MTEDKNRHHEKPNWNISTLKRTLKNQPQPSIDKSLSSKCKLTNAEILDALEKLQENDSYQNNQNISQTNVREGSEYNGKSI